ncbi:glycosyltransferase [Thauera aromatica]|nr:glycosyltransferase [Thauera aromatica]
MQTTHQTLFAQANSALRRSDYASAITLYEEALLSAEEPLKERIRFNLEITYRRANRASLQIRPSDSTKHSLPHIFDSEYYLSNNEDVKKVGIDPQEHYWSAGENEGRWPNSDFDPNFYLRTNADVRAARISPFRHFIDAGFKEGRLARSPLAENPRPSLNEDEPLLFVGHDGIQAGSEVVLLEVIRWFYENTLRKIKLLLLEPGPLASRYAKYSDLYVLPKNTIDEPNSLKDFLNENFQFIYLNTVVSGRFLKIIEEQRIQLDSPIVAHIHEMEKVLNIFSIELEHLKNRVDHWISASPASTAALSENHAIELTAITTVPAFINPIANKDASSNELKENARHILGLSENDFVVMGCGTVYWRKGTDLFVETARLLRTRSKRPIKFVWLGDGPDLSSLQASLSLEELNYITFTGNREDANFLLAAADVFFLSSREDPFPLVVLESAQHGVPSICFSPATGITEFIETDAGIALSQFSVDSAADALYGLLNDKDRLRKLGDVARQRLFDGYTAKMQNLMIYEAVKRHVGYRPAVSVIVPFYNHESFVDERLKSIINQVIKDIEIIILDDRSTDRTVEKIQPYLSDSRIRLIENSFNSGSPFAQWERGITQAQADIIWIAEGDDSCDLNFLSTLLPYFNDPMINIAAARTEIIDDKGQLQPQALTAYLDMAYPGKFHQSYLLDGFIEVEQQLGAMCTLVNASGLLLRKSCLKSAVQQAQRWKMCGDWLIYLECLRGGKIAYDVNTQNLFRRHSSSQVHKIEGTPTYFLERFKITDYVVKHYPVSDDLINKAFAAIDHEWQRFQHKNPGLTLDSFYDKASLEKNLKHSRNHTHVAFYVHGMTFSKGGIERLAAQLANHLAENGWKVTIYCRINKNTRPIYPLYESVCVKPIFDETNLGPSVSSLEQALRDDKVEIFVPMLSEWLFEPIVEAAITTGVKIVASEHNDPWKIEELWWSREGRIRCFEKADTIHLILDKFRESLPEHLQHKTVIIPNGAETPEQVELNNREKLILGVGRLEPQKRFDRLIDAIALAQKPLRENGYQVEIYGEGSLKHNLEKQIFDQNVADIVSLKGKTDKIKAVYSRSSLLICPSEFEAFGMVVVEALAHGTPVIGFINCNGVNEIIRNNIDGYLVEDVASLSKVLTDNISGPSVAMRRSAVDRASQYSMNNFYQSWTAILSEQCECSH